MKSISLATQTTIFETIASLTLAVLFDPVVGSLVEFWGFDLAKPTRGVKPQQKAKQTMDRNDNHCCSLLEHCAAEPVRVMCCYARFLSQTKSCSDVKSWNCTCMRPLNS